MPFQQVGNTWTGGDAIVSLSMSGDLNVFDKRVGDKPASVLHVRSSSPSFPSSSPLVVTAHPPTQGPQKAITAAVPLPASASTPTFLAGTADGRVLAFAEGAYAHVTGAGHAALVAGLAAAPDGTVFSAGFDDTVKEIEGGAGFVCVFLSMHSILVN